MKNILLPVLKYNKFFLCTLLLIAAECKENNALK